jgi:hypothetical protein
MANKQKRMQETEIAEVAQMFFEQRVSVNTKGLIFCK